MKVNFLAYTEKVKYHAESIIQGQTEKFYAYW